MTGDPSLTKFLQSAFASESKVRFCFAFIVNVSFLFMVDTWESGQELGLKADVPSLRHLPCVRVTEHTYISVLPENVPSEVSSQHLWKSDFFGIKLSSLCGKC